MWHVGNCSYGVAARRQRWRDFLDLDSAPQHLFLINVQNQDNPVGQINPYSLLWPENKHKLVGVLAESYAQSVERISWLHDDFVPYAAMTSGTEIFAEAFGCKVSRPENNMPCAIPCVSSAREAAMVAVPKLEDTPLMIHFEVADKVKGMIGDEVPLKMVDIQSPMSIVAQIWEKSALFPAMITEPEAVHELALKARELVVSLFRRMVS